MRKSIVLTSFWCLRLPAPSWLLNAVRRFLPLQVRCSILPTTLPQPSINRMLQRFRRWSQRTRFISTKTGMRRRWRGGSWR